ncbi:MAG TPA: hypothetical protein VFD23_05315 [Clostridia bacterium]|nr:hypothetical protein [Clostridia bacterium]
MADAQVTEQLSKTIIGSKSKAPKVDGVSTRTDWEIIDVDSKAVPTEFAGIEIRPVNTSALMSLIRSSNGSISIPGVKYKEVTKMSFRR